MKAKSKYKVFEKSLNPDRDKNYGDGLYSEGVIFKDKYYKVIYIGQNPVTKTYVFTDETGKFFERETLYKCTLVDPRKTPCCEMSMFPEDKPFLAFVPNEKVITSHTNDWWTWRNDGRGWMAGANGSCRNEYGIFYAIDVRTEFAKKNYPEIVACYEDDFEEWFEEADCQNTTAAKYIAKLAWEAAKEKYSK